MAMFVALYRWRIRPGREDDFRDAWRRMTELVRERCASGGSALFRDGDGTFVAIARWENRDAWRRRFAEGSPDAALAAQMSDAVLERFRHVELEGLDDHWTPLTGPERFRAGRPDYKGRYRWRHKEYLSNSEH